MSLLGVLFHDSGYGAMGADDPNPASTITEVRDPSLMQKAAEEFGPSAGQVYTDRATIQAVQAALTVRGYNPGDVDGVFGPKTEAALTDYNAARGLAKHGPPDDEVLQALGVAPPAPIRLPPITIQARPAAVAAAPAPPNVVRTPLAPASSSGEIAAAGVGLLAAALLLGGKKRLGRRRSSRRSPAARRR